MQTPLKREIAQAVAEKKANAVPEEGASKKKMQTPLKREIAQAAAEKKAKMGERQGSLFFFALFFLSAFGHSRLPPHANAHRKKLQTPLRQEIASAGIQSLRAHEEKS